MRDHDLDDVVGKQARSAALMMTKKPAPDCYLLAKTSALHHVCHLTHRQISERLRVPRSDVPRLLSLARDLGYVQAIVASPRGTHLGLETLLEERFRLQMAHVVANETDRFREPMQPRLGVAAAQYLTRSVRAGETIGLAWGLRPDRNRGTLRSDVHVLQTLGDLGTPGTPEYGTALVRRLSKLVDAPPVLLPAPGIRPNPASLRAARTQSVVQNTLAGIEASGTLYVGLRARLQDRQVGHATRVEEPTRRNVADISARLGVTTVQMRHIDRIVAVTGATDSIAPIAAVLGSSVVDVLITDLATATRLVDSE